MRKFVMILLMLFIAVSFAFAGPITVGNEFSPTTSPVVEATVLPVSTVTMFPDVPMVQTSPTNIYLSVNEHSFATIISNYANENFTGVIYQRGVADRLIFPTNPLDGKNCSLFWL